MEQKRGRKDDEKTAKVHCDVKNCVYHSHDYLCEAGEIKVGPHYAEGVEDTVCATFEQKE